MHIVLFEDEITTEMRPVTLCRPAFGIHMAATSLYAASSCCAESVSAIVRMYLEDVTRAAFSLAELPDRNVLFLNASLAPSPRAIDQLAARAKQEGDFLVEKDERVAAAFIAAPAAEYKGHTPATIAAHLRSLQLRKVDEDLPLMTLPCDVIRYHQKLFNENVQRLASGLFESQPGVFCGGDVKIHPTAVLDASEGPIILENGVSVGPFALIIGPAVIGANTRIIERASIKEQVQIGSTCKIGGEVECSIVEPYTNKQHHGFLGHSWIGSWVNLGAGTSNSDLKNTYGEITFLHRGHKVNTGMQFLGCIMGDFSKAAINTSIFTGKAIGVGSYLYGFVGTNVPSFTNYARTFGQETECLLDSVVRTQARMFARRKIAQTPADVRLLEDVHEITRDERLMSTDQVMF